jgi:hypothetical protein
VIRDALATRPAVSAPPGGDWSGFMTRLNGAVAAEHPGGMERAHASLAADDGEPPAAASPRAATLRAAPYLAMAALLVLVTMSVAYVARTGWSRDRRTVPSMATVSPPAASTGALVLASDPDSSATLQSAFAILSEQHLERSKMVVLGLANKDARRARLEDWEYERQLASSLLTDTRLYRMAAEERGLKTIADVMRDLELVLLQTSLAAHSGSADLAQIQRLIDKRDLVTKIDLAAGI